MESTKIEEEVKVWNTPLAGAFLLWRFTIGFCNAHPSGDAPVGILHFIAGAILTSGPLSKGVSNRRANLQSYVRGFLDHKEIDFLLSIHERIKEKRKYTMASIDIAVASGLLVWDVREGRLFPRELTSKPSRGRAPRTQIRSDGQKAEILGKWFAEHDILTIASYLSIVL